jgi:hypothetical protein
LQNLDTIRLGKHHGRKITAEKKKKALNFEDIEDCKKIQRRSRRKNRRSSTGKKAEKRKNFSRYVDNP